MNSKYLKSDSDLSDDNVAEKPTVSMVSRKKPTDVKNIGIKQCRLENNWSNKIIFKSDFYTNFIKISSGNKETTVGTCVKCGRNIRGQCGVSSNFVSHLKCRHPDEFKKYRNLKFGNLRIDPQQHDLDVKILKFIINAIVPVSIIESPSFLALFGETEIKIMSKQKAIKKLEDAYQKMLNRIKSEISTGEYFCTTANVWSFDPCTFFTYTCHWINGNSKRQTAVLAYKRLNKNCTPENLLQIIGKINSSFGLNNKHIIMTLTEGEIDMAKACRDYDFQIMEYEEDLIAFHNDKFFPQHQQCYSHSLISLATMDFYKILEDEKLYKYHKIVLEKCHSLWKECSDYESDEKVASILGSEWIIQPVTNWVLLHAAITQTLQHKSKLDVLCKSLNITQFSVDEIAYLESYKMLTDPIAHALKFLQNDKSNIFGCLIPVVMSLTNQLDKLSKKEFRLQTFAGKLCIDLRKRFEIFFTLAPEANLALTAAALTSEVKLEWLPVLQKFVPEITKDHICTRVIEQILNFTQMFNITTHTNKTTNDITNTFFDFDTEDSDNESNNQTGIKQEDMREAIQREFYAFIHSSDFIDKFPLLKQASLYFNTPLVSSAPVEKLLSFVDNLYSTARETWSDFSLEKLMLLKANR